MSSSLSSVRDLWLADGAIEAHRFVKPSGAQQVEQADTAGDEPIGVSLEKVADGEEVEVVRRGGSGCLIEVADSSASIGAILKVDANGRGTAATAGTDRPVAVLLEAVTAANQVVQAVLF